MTRPTSSLAASSCSDALGVRRPALAASCTAPWGVALALAAALLACRAREGDRCVCAEDCHEDLVCVASGRVLAAGECSPAVGQDSNPGVCLPAEEAVDGDGGDAPPEVFMDLGSKRDFDPGPPPDPETGTGETGTGTTSGSGSSSDGGTTDATGTSSGGSSSSGTTDATGTSSGGGSSSGGTTDATGASSGSSSGSSGSTGGT
jgi:hypothetical protein